MQVSSGSREQDREQLSATHSGSANYPFSIHPAVLVVAGVILIGCGMGLAVLPIAAAAPALIEIVVLVFEVAGAIIGAIGLYNLTHPSEDIERRMAINNLNRAEAHRMTAAPNRPLAEPLATIIRDWEARSQVPDPEVERVVREGHEVNARFNRTVAESLQRCQDMQQLLNESFTLVRELSSLREAQRSDPTDERAAQIAALEARSLSNRTRALALAEPAQS